LGSRLAAGNVGYKLVAILHRLAIDRNNRVTNFETGLLGWTVGHNIRDRDARIHAVDACDGRVLLGVELDADRAAGNAVFRSNKLGVNLHNGIGWKREAN